MQESGRKNGRMMPIIAIAAIAAVAVLPFLHVLSFGIINLDDYWYVAYHDPIMAGLGWDGVKFAFTCLEEGIWMPLTWISYMIDRSLFGDAWGWYHLHSVLIHGANAVLVFVLIREIFGERKSISLFHNATFIAAVAAMIWAVHPLRVESVAWIASRKDVLSMFWMLVAMILWLRPVGEADALKTEAAKRVPYKVLAMVALALGAMAKPSVMTFPFLCFSVEFFVRRNVRLLHYVAPTAFCAVLGAFAAHAQAVGGATQSIVGEPFWYKLLNAATSFGLYLWNTAWPVDLAPQCVLRWPELPRFCIPGVVIGAAVAGWIAWRLWRLKERFDDEVEVVWHGLSPEWRRRGAAEPALAGFLWFALAVAPMLGIAGFGYHAMADRFTYIPSIGISIAAAALLERFAGRACAKALKPRAVGTVVVFAAILALGALTWRQTGYWRDDHALFSHTVEVDGERSAPAHGILANWYFEFPHDLEQCAKHFGKVRDVNLRFVEMSFQVYIFALCELGREREVPELLKMYDGWIRREAEENPRYGKGSLRARMMRAVYFFSRVAYLITQPDLRKAAREELYGTECPEDEPSLLYLRWRLAIAESGGTDTAAAQEAKRNLIEKALKKGYTQCRYLKNETKGGDA